MHIAYFWLTMGHYHFARMNAIAALETVEKLTVFEATDLDDHYWKREENESLPFEHRVLYPQNVLDYEITGKAWTRLKEVLADISPDILVNGAGYFHPKNYKVLRAWKKQSGKKLVLWSESTAIDQKRNLAKEFVKRQVLKIYDAAIVAGSMHKEYLVDLGFPENRIQVVGNVVDNDFFESQKQSQRNGFLYVGRMLDIKNVQNLIEAYARYRKDAKNPQPLYLVGDGPLKDDFEQKVKSQNIKGIVFTGNLQVDQVKEYYKQCRFFILPSFSEPWGLVINEAMASGLPVAASVNCGATHDLVHPEKNGFVFAPNNVNDIVAVLHRLDSLSESQYDEMSSYAKSYISNYSPEKYAVNCDALFTKLMT